ncbi:cytochrome-c oxidase, cbb3-type subunit II [Candidatus Albibeggiatoa sp. nov. NOAA]|uniref:cytochrome-c oxidase, cbb3-type subunit II n=1 Tax=Candidatus Albibeggiatoa sp. nov. NOAA TaxID=3162724 RepID=UPI0032F5B5E6|nr:cytochrome-c oxidase, cbb3-type subunit II [Thiotrichaceae bacterium]
MAASTGHEKVEKNLGLMIILIILVISVGGLIQIVPLFYMKDMIEPAEGLKPYSAIELAGRDIYIRESCNVCHSQMVRPFRAETERYGHYSVASEFVYDRPFLWGSKRTGPDLHRVGGRYSDEWHIQHLMDPRSVVPESVMPAYPWLADGMVDGEDIKGRMETLKKYFGHPYSQEEIDNAPKDLEGVTEMDAIVAYLQGMGTTVKTVR